MLAERNNYSVATSHDTVSTKELSNNMRNTTFNAIRGNSQSKESCITTDKLFKGTKELIIEHGGEKYRLRITGKGKLILTK